MRLARNRRPVGKQNLRPALDRFVAGIGLAGETFSRSTKDVHHRFLAPPTLPLHALRAGQTGSVEQAEIERNQRPARRLPKIIDPRPDKLAGVRRIVPEREPDPLIVTIFRSENFPRWFGGVRGEDFF